jgi:flagella basal body P-ring formation protein FlgA
MRILPALLLATVAFPVFGATLRNGTTLSGPSVRLSDLFDGVEQDCVLGPGPELGGRIVVEAPQLAAIARQFGVDWRPVSLGDQITLERPGEPFAREDALAVLRQALQTAGASADADLDVPGFTPPMVPPGSNPRATAEQVDYSAADGRFSAMLAITGAKMPPIRMRVAGRVTEMIELPVATRRMLPGDVIGPGDVQAGRIRASAIRAEVARSATQAVGMALHHVVGPGAPFVLADLVRPTAVEKGKTVQMVLEAPGLSLSAQGVAVDSGAIGERIRVLNPQSRAMIEAEVIGAGRVRASGGLPVFLPAGAALPVRVASR